VGRAPCRPLLPAEAAGRAQGCGATWPERGGHRGRRRVVPPGLAAAEAAGRAQARRVAGFPPPSRSVKHALFRRPRTPSPPRREERTARLSLHDRLVRRGEAGAAPAVSGQAFPLPSAPRGHAAPAAGVLNGGEGSAAAGPPRGEGSAGKAGSGKTRVLLSFIWRLRGAGVRLPAAAVPGWWLQGLGRRGCCRPSLSGELGPGGAVGRWGPGAPGGPAGRPPRGAGAVGAPRPPVRTHSSGDSWHSCAEGTLASSSALYSTN